MVRAIRTRMNSPHQKRRGDSACALVMLLAAALLTISCASTQEVVLGDDEMFHLASRKLEMSEQAGLIWGITHSKEQSQALELFNELLDRYPESPHAKKAQMLLADTLFADKKHEEAEAEYTSFLRFYPSDVEAQKAQFRLLLTFERRTRTYDRDQSFTHKTLEFCRQYRRNYPGGQFTQHVAVIEREARAMLGMHEFYVGRLYFRRHKYAAATSRLEGVLRDYSDTEAAPRALLYLAKTDLKLKRRDEARQKLRKLIDNYPGSQCINRARRLSKALAP
ncbi:MAG TPA: outer membrane protein assembly factor BamD [bacterium]|nr:outer membrane protein assembly factor BamD [bacterium]